MKIPVDLNFYHPRFVSSSVPRTRICGAEALPQTTAARLNAVTHRRSTLLFNQGSPGLLVATICVSAAY